MKEMEEIQEMDEDDNMAFEKTGKFSSEERFHNEDDSFKKHGLIK